MSDPQAGIVPPVPPHARYIEFVHRADADLKSALGQLARLAVDDRLVVGIGSAVAQALGHSIPGLRAMPSLAGPGCVSPSTQSDLWLWIRGEDRGRILHVARECSAALSPGFRLERSVDGFRFDRGLDLTGYEDGTENPTGEDADKTAFMRAGSPGMNGSSFVAVQQWQHDLGHFESLTQTDRDHIIGRRLSDNEELDDAPASAHVKRTAQESFDPEAFVLRRSMPWAGGHGEGLMFVAFGHTLDAFEVQVRRMTGQDDGIVDGLFRFSRPLTGSYFWCPPVNGERLDLSALGI